MPTDSAQSNDARQVIIELANALHTHGVAAHDLEESMAETALALGIEAKYFATPTSIFIAFGAAADHQTTLIRVAPGDVNLDKLCQLYALQAELTDGSLNVTSGLERIREIVRNPARYGWALTIPATGITAATAAPFFGGGWHELGLAGLLGLMVGSLAWLTSRHPRTRNLLLPAASLLVSMVAFSASAVWPNVTSGIVTVSALILFIPGLTLTIAMNELATQNLVSGSARFVGAMSQLMILGFGVALGRSLIAIVVEPVGNPLGDGLGLAVVVICLLLASIAFTVLFQARPRDFPFICMAGFLAFFGAKTGVQILGTLAGPSLAAFVLGTASNMMARLRRKPASVTLVPGLLLLVPGSIGFKSVAELLEKESLQSFESAFTMVLVAAAIVTGMLLANVIVPQEPVTRSNAKP
jgi:uncharacterized membrane protein YjjP (DUF1212 family)